MVDNMEGQFIGHLDYLCGGSVMGSNLRMNKKNNMKKLILFLVIVSLIVTSCKSTGYGCRGRESWGGMVKRINKLN